MLTNKGLVDYARKALAEKWGYVWGTFGQVLTETLYQQKLQQYPDQVGSFKAFIRANWLGRKVADCVGLIKGYYWSESGTLKYNPATDVNANSMLSLAKEKGVIDTIPEVPGLCVWKQGHIGVYIGNGQVIEARGTKYGVIQTPLRGTGSTPWTHWLKCPFIEYVEEVKALTWKEILKAVASNPAEWEEAINVAVAAAKADGNLGALEIFKFLPELIEKVYNSRG